MPRVTRRRLGALILIIAGLAALAIPFLFYGPSSSGTTTPPPPGGGGTTPPSSRNGGGSPPGSGSGDGSVDTSPPKTTITITGPLCLPRESSDSKHFSRDNDDEDCSPSFTTTLHATDDMNLSIVILNDTGTVHQWIVSGTSANVTLTITSAGLHQLAYWSIDKAGNKETPHTTKFDLVRADVDDHLRSCDTSKIDHDDIRDSPSVKLHDVQEKQAACHKDKNPDITTDQPNGLAGQSWLDQNLANMLLAIFKIISNLSTLVLSAS